LILCGVSNQAFIVRESYPTWRYPVTLIVDEDFDCSGSEPLPMGVPDDEPFPFFITPTQEYVVPKSMPMTRGR